MIKSIIVASFFAGMSGTLAQAKDVVLADSGWICTDYQGLADFHFKKGDIQVNNFSLDQDVGLLSGIPRLKLTFSSVNRGNDTRNFDIEMVGYDETHHVSFALEAAPSFSAQIEGHRTLGSEASIYALPETLTLTKSYCFRFVGDF